VKFGIKVDDRPMYCYVYVYSEIICNQVLMSDICDIFDGFSVESLMLN